MAFWPFGSKAKKTGPEIQDVALGNLSRLFLSSPDKPTPGSDLLDVTKFDFSMQSLALLDDHLEVMRGKNLEGKELLLFVLRAGAYVGEVIRKHTPGPTPWHWLMYEDAVGVDPKLEEFGKNLGTVAVLWDGGKGFIFPLGKVAKFLQNGREDSVNAFAQVIVAGPPTSGTAT